MQKSPTRKNFKKGLGKDSHEKFKKKKKEI